MVTTKTCRKCGHAKELSEYTKHKDGEFGLSPRCRDCLREDRAAKADEARERARAWRLANPEKAKEKSRAWYQANRERAIATAQAYVEANAEKVAERKKAWLYVRRASGFGFNPEVEHFTGADMVERYGDSCFYCEAGAFEQVDHYVPVSKGGPHTLANVRPSCASCNNSKGSSDPEIFEGHLDYERRTR